MNTTFTKRFGMGVLIAALAGSALAIEPDTSDADLLRGPEVVESSGPDAGDTMTGERDKARPTGDLPFRAYLGAVRGLNKAAQENPELALTDGQKEEIKAIGAAHREKMKAFMDEHKDEFAEFRGMRGEQQGQRGEKGQRGAKGQRGGPPGELGDEPRPQGERGERPSPEDRQRAREKMGDLMSKAPSDQEAKKALWAALTPEQQEAVKANIKDMRAKRQERIDGAMESGRKGKEGKKGKERKGEEQGMIGKPIFEIDEPLPDPDDC